jgi:hypothetical protein
MGDRQCHMVYPTSAQIGVFCRPLQAGCARGSRNGQEGQDFSEPLLVQFPRRREKPLRAQGTPEHRAR